MEYLKTARVLVIDDSDQEAMLLIRALGQLGIGCIHITGDDDGELKNAPFSGIRVAFVDMDLNIGGFGETRAKAIVSKTIAVFKSAISETNPPCVVIAWTKHKDVVDAFRDAIKNDIPSMVPDSIVTLEKPTEFNLDSLGPLIHSLESYLDDNSPLPALWSWEQAAHDAATQVTSLISEVATKQCQEGTGKWLSSLSSSLRALITASSGQSIQIPLVSRHLYEALNALHLDVLEQSGNEMSGEQVDFILKSGKLSQNAKVAFNTRMLVCKARNEKQALHPGNVYLMKCGNGAKQAFEGIVIDTKSVVSDFDIEWKKVND